MSNFGKSSSFRPRLSNIGKNSNFVLSQSSNDKFDEFLSNLADKEKKLNDEMETVDEEQPTPSSPLPEQQQLEVVLEGNEGKYSSRVARKFHAATRRKHESMGRLNSVAHQGWHMVTSNLGLLILLLLYACAGAAMFSALEGPTDVELRNHLELSRKLFIDNVSYSIDLLLNKSVPFKSSNVSINTNNITEVLENINDSLRIYEDILKNSPTQIVKYNSSNIFHGWTFFQSLFFCGTVFTTVGYGNVSPVTIQGRVACMFYAAFGIPICLIFLSRTGKTMTRGIKFIWCYIRRFYYTGSCRKVRKMIPLSRIRMSAIQRVGVQIRSRSARRKGGIFSAELQRLRKMDDTYVPYEVDDKFNLPPIVAFIIAFLYIFLCASLYSQWERWTYLEAFYFTFITFCTIGFGDITPEHPNYFLLSSILLLIGLALVAMVINVIMETVSETITMATDQVINVGQKIRRHAPNSLARQRGLANGKSDRRKSV